MYTYFNTVRPDSLPKDPKMPPHPSFECHITIPTSASGLGKVVAKLRGWTTSEINRDPVLGDDSYFYLTLHRTSYLELEEEMIACCRDLQRLDAPVLRCKIEQIVFDTKTGIGTLSHANLSGAVPTKPVSDGSSPPVAMHPISGAHSL